MGRDRRVLRAQRRQALASTRLTRRSWCGKTPTSNPRRLHQRIPTPIGGWTSLSARGRRSAVACWAGARRQHSSEICAVIAKRGASSSTAAALGLASPPSTGWIWRTEGGGRRRQWRRRRGGFLRAWDWNGDCQKKDALDEDVMPTGLVSPAASPITVPSNRRAPVSSPGARELVLVCSDAYKQNACAIPPTR